MKRINTLKGLCVSAMLGTSFCANAQIHAVAYPAHAIPSGTTQSNFYKDYVGVRLEVTAPVGSPIVGDKQYTTANDGGGGTGVWGAPVSTPIINADIIMPPGTDSLVAGSIPVGTMAGKIAFVYRGGGIEFGAKAYNCYLANAVAVVIVNNVAGGPVGMAAGAKGGLIPITMAGGGTPVFMISKEEGDVIDGYYRAGATVKMTITNWSQNFTNDLGFVPQGIATWHASCIPANQLTGAGTPDAYKMVDGAFIANYGTATMSSVKLASELSFTPTGGSLSSVHTSTVSLPSFPTSDSIWAMFDTLSTATNIYDVTASGTGRFDIKYTISAGVTDDFTGDNVASASFYATDSLYSKGKYDMTNNAPYATAYRGSTGTNPYMFGPMYFVKNGGAVISRLQYSLSSNSTTSSSLDAGSNDAYVFKWVDGDADRGLPADGILQAGELICVGKGTKNYTAGVDTSRAILNMNIINIDSTNAGSSTPITLENNTWYYVAIEVPGGYYLGCDGSADPLPRVYGYNYSNVNAVREYQAVFTNQKATLYDDPNYQGNYAPVISSQTAYINSVDSFVYSASKGDVPAVAMIVNNSYTPPPPVDHSAVKNVNTTFAGVVVAPNPATDHVDVTVDLNKKANKVTYTVIDGLARFVSKEVHTNVSSEKYTINTANLAAGIYTVVVDADGSAIAKRFVVAK